MVGVEGDRDDPGGWVMTRPVGFRSGRARQAIASSRSCSNRSGGSFSSRAIAAALAQGLEAVEPLAICRLNRVARAWACSDSNSCSRPRSRLPSRSRCLTI